MSIVVHNFEQPDRFVAGTVGEPGQRTFFLQAREGNRITSVALEKQQVSVLAERVDLLLDEALRRSGGDVTIPAVAPVGMGDQDPLDLPIVEEFRVGTITLSWDSEDRRVVIELFPVTDETVVMQSFDDDDDDSDDPVGPDEGDDFESGMEIEVDAGLEIEVEVEASEVLVVKLEPAYARAFVRRALSVVSAGRAPCQFCGNPIDPEGHLCPRANGFRRVAD
jgi:uncharacterized repeat protein (TIGR03847 family)